jgi:hypothetical protein
MGFIVGFLLTYLPAEDCFWTMARLLHAYRLDGMFRPKFPRLKLLNHQLDALLRDRLPAVSQHLVGASRPPPSRRSRSRSACMHMRVRACRW